MPAYDIASSDSWGPGYIGTPHKYGSNLYVRLMRSYYYNTANNGKFSVWKSTDNGLTWSQQDVEKGGEDNRYAIAGRGIIHGSVLYISYYNHVIPHTIGSGTIRVARFDLSTDTWLSDWTGGPSVVDFSHITDVAFDSSGNGTVVYSDWSWNNTTTPLFKNTRQISYVTISSSGTWGSPVNLTDFEQTNDSYGYVVYDSTDTRHIFYSDSTGGNISTLSTVNGTVFDATGGGTLYAARGFPILVNIGGVESIAIGYLNTSGVTGVWTCPVGSSTWTSTNSPGGASGYDLWSLASTGNIVYAVWNDGTNLGEIYTAELSEGSWTNFTTITPGGSAEYGSPLTANMLGTTTLGIVAEDWNDGRAWFISATVAAAASPIRVTQVIGEVMFKPDSRVEVWATQIMVASSTRSNGLVLNNPMMI